jgi:RNA polymerase sigma-70 factor, ECF subfamily
MSNTEKPSHNRAQEADLVRRLHRNDLSAIEELYTTYFDRLYALVFNQVDRDRSATEDIVQETFLAALKSAKRFHGQSSTYTWLCSIAYHKVADFYRRKAREGKYRDLTFNVDASESGEQPGSILRSSNPTSSIDTSIIVKQAMATLTSDHRQVLILKYVEEMSVSEISQIMGRSQKSIEGLLARARKTLQAKLPAPGE